MRRAAAILGALALVLPGASGCVKKETTMMDAALRALDRHPELAVTVRLGTEYFRDGRIAVTVHGDGATTVEQLRSGTLTEYRAQLAAARVAEVGVALAERRFTEPRTSKLPRDPGDTPLRLALARGGTLLFQVDLWYGDRYTDANLNAIVELAENLVFEASGGKLGQQAR
jgi:hypothetical protein